MLPPSVELVNPKVRRGPFRAELFDFDGTLSLIRGGWPRVMIDPLLGERVFAPKDNDATFRKRDVIERAVRELGIRGEELIGFGDGVVETQEVKRVGGLAVGVASVEAGARGVNAAKRDTLIAAGADLIIPDYEHAG